MLKTKLFSKNQVYSVGYGTSFLIYQSIPVTSHFAPSHFTPCHFAPSILPFTFHPFVISPLCHFAPLSFRPFVISPLCYFAPCHFAPLSFFFFLFSFLIVVYMLFLGLKVSHSIPFCRFKLF
jgi:hypothetical protein